MTAKQGPDILLWIQESMGHSIITPEVNLGYHIPSHGVLYLFALLVE